MIGFLGQLAQRVDAFADIAPGQNVMGDAAVGGDKGPGDLFHEE
ncbi:MAG: hypothetical protein ACD_10C00779G0001, partial [uncultured bacterium]